jgi:hypothetical protein
MEMEETTQEFMEDVKSFLDESVTVLESIGAQVETVSYIKTRNIFEVIADISMIAGGLMADGRIEIEDSREFVNVVIPGLAQDFELGFTQEMESAGLYMELVDEFATKQLLELYGTLKEVEEEDEAERFQSPTEIQKVTAYCHLCHTEHETELAFGEDRKYPEDFAIECGNPECNNCESGSLPAQTFNIIE